MMERLQTHMIGVDHGEVVVFSDFEHDGLMWAGEGPRQMTKHVEFSEAYRNKPIVQVHLTMWDMSTKANIRMDVQAEEVTETGFKIVFRTWGDSKIARVRVAWHAIGEVVNEDDWQLY